jgi:hypothetical protein
MARIYLGKSSGKTDEEAFKEKWDGFNPETGEGVDWENPGSEGVVKLLRNALLSAYEDVLKNDVKVDAIYESPEVFFILKPEMCMAMGELSRRSPGSRLF